MIVDGFDTFGIHGIRICRESSSQCRVLGVLNHVLVVLLSELGSSQSSARVSILVFTDADLSS